MVELFFQDIITADGVSTTDLFAAIDNISTSIRTASSGVEAAKAEGMARLISQMKIQVPTHSQ